MSVSITTILVFVGLAMALTSTYMQVMNYERQLAETKKLSDNLQFALERAGRVTITAHISLEGVDKKSRPGPGDVFCSYIYQHPDMNEDMFQDAKVNQGVSLDYWVTLEDIRPHTLLKSIDLEDRKNMRLWRVELEPNFKPLSPKFNAKLVK